MKGWFSNAFIQRLNEQMGAGTFLRAAIVDDPVSGLRYFVNAERAITFAGNTYSPLGMHSNGIEVAHQMALPQIEVSVANLDSTISDYLENVYLVGRAVTLQILHMDLLGTITDVDTIKLLIMAISGGLTNLLTFHLGLNVGLGEMLPREVITSTEFPGVPQTIRRATLLGI